MADMDENEDNATKSNDSNKGVLKKISLKRVKKKNINLNISKGNLKSVNNNKPFNFLNMSIQKQTLRANNKALAQNLAKTRQQLQQMNTYTQQLQSENQELKLELNKLRAVVGIKDDKIEDEVQRRIELTMKGMKVVCEELGNSMFQSSQYLQSLFSKFDQYCGGNSRKNSRGSSLGSGDDDGETTRPAPITTTTARRNVFGGMAGISSKQRSGEMTGGVSVSRFTPAVADMSIIAETSILDTDDDVNTCPRTALEPVTEGVVSQKRPTVSSLPQRIPKPDSKLDTIDNGNKANSKIPVSRSSRRSLDGNSGNNESDKAKEPPKDDKEVEVARSKDKNKKGKTDTETDNSKDKEAISKDRNTKRTTVNKASGKPNKTTDTNKDDKQIGETTKAKQDNNPTPESELDEEDLTSFGFSELLASGSSVAESKKAEKEASKGVADDKDKKQADKQAVKGKQDKALVKSKSDSNLKTGDKLKPSDKSKPGDKSKVDNKPKPEDKKVSKGSFQAPKAVEKIEPKKVVPESKAMKTKRQTYVAENPFKPKTCLVTRSPSKNQSAAPSLQDYEVDNPFKPTKTLQRSPIHGERKPDEDKPTAGKIDSHSFLSRFKENLDRLSHESAPLPEPSFQDEPTTYFNTDMEFTAVIDTASFLKNMTAKSKSSADSTVETDVEKSAAKENSQKEKPEGNEVKARTRERRDRTVSEKDKQDNVSDERNDEGAAVEVRTMKPGVFTFSVSRKDADGTRKPVPEPVKKARSKKKVVPQIDEEPRKTGDDRDMFNFGDRTPTMPLEKMPKSALHDPYELSMTEGPAGQNSVKERLGKPTKLPNVLSAGATYTVPMKGGSPDEKPEKSKSSRSKSETRSKSRNRDSDSDDDYEPEKARSKARARSRGRSVKKANEDSDTEEKIPTRSKSRGRAAKVIETEVQAAVERNTRTRSKSRSRKSYVEPDSDEEFEELETVEPNEPSRKSRTRTRKTEGAGDDVNAREQTAKARSRSRLRSQTDAEKDDRDRRSRSGSQTSVKDKPEESEDKPKEPEAKDKDVAEDRDKQCHKMVKERSRSKRKVANDDDEDFVASARRGRSRSRIRTLKDDKSDDVKADNDKVKDKVRETVEENYADCGRSRRKSSRSVKRTTEVDDDALEEKKDIKEDDSAGKEELDEDNDDFAEMLRGKRKSRVNKRKTFVVESDDDEDKKNGSKSPELVKKVEKSEKKLTTKKNKLNSEPTLMTETTDSDGYQAIKPIRRKSTKVLDKTFSKDDEGRLDQEETESDDKGKEVRETTKDHKAKDNENKAKDDENKVKDDVNKAKDNENELNDVHGNSDDCVNLLDKHIHVTTKRGRSSRHRVKDISKDDDEVKENVDNNDIDNDNVDDKRGEVTHSERKAKSPKTGSKSTRKGTERKQKDRKREKSIRSKIFQGDDEEGSLDSLPEKTPATVGARKGAKSTKITGRAAQKRRAVDVDNNDVTPKVKKDNIEEAKQVTEKPGDDKLAALKRRLTMMNARKQSSTDLNPANLDAREEENTADREDDDGDDGRRQRRNKIPVSYKTLPLNAKLRQGDKLFVMSENSAKAKAEQMRLALCRKTSAPRISIDDQENIPVDT